MIDASEELRTLYQSPVARFELFQIFSNYLNTVPRIGAVLVDETWEKCLMVESWKGSARPNLAKLPTHIQSCQHIQDIVLRKHK